MIPRWVAACVVAEGIGMAAAAGAARASDHVDTATGLVLILTGGLVEGTALGVLQSSAIGDILGARRKAWVLATVLAAGLGWAAGSVPGTLSEDSGGTTPQLGLILLGAVGIGLVLGPVLGLAQSLALRTRVRHPFRWVVANAAGWSVAMPVIFLGATTAGATWAWPTLVLFGAATGAVAGCVLGVVTGTWLASLDGPPLRHRIVLALLGRRRRPTGPGLIGLAVTGTRTGRAHRFPVMAAPLGSSSLVVLPGHPERKRWWRNLRGGADVEVLDDGGWRPAVGHVLEHGSLEWSVARAAYRAKWRRADVGHGPLVVLALEPDNDPRRARRDQGPVDGGPATVGVASGPS